MSSNVRSGTRAWLIVAATFLVTNVGATAYALARETPSGRFGFLSTVAVVAVLWYWLWDYARRHGHELPFDIGFYLALGLPVVLPVLAFRYQRWRGLWAVAGIVAVFVATYTAAAGLFYFIE